MIGQIKVATNAAEIKKAQEVYQQVAQENAQIESKNSQLAKSKRAPLIPMPSIPEMECKNTDILLKVDKVDLAFVNANGDISISYLGKDFNLVYSDQVWEELKQEIK